jgi:hypothetical protein
MFDYLLKQIAYLPPLPRKKNPILALAIGFLTGGIGLVFYFRTRIDTLICVILTIGLYVYMTQVVPDLSLWYGWSVTAIYGYARVQDSKARCVQTES